ncbi:DUF3055 domain-containing protein [Melghirimyces algeriensis]|uniref:DUF3055 domain-containing protein n=1 Tax=Melghirimyces algeriensis TaxID=910412 RepID=A0A521EIG8_9BACL|nr:DUF3055 domain-containing protein [Melghirimyces algeriensis]SMO83652.1 Protein of unknown function [Melghirimyces algeriensis]
MSQESPIFLYDETEETRTRFVSFIGENSRFDLGITITDRFYGKLLVFNIQSSRFAIIGPDDLEEPGYLEEVYHLNADEAEELKQFLFSLF